METVKSLVCLFIFHFGVINAQSESSNYLDSLLRDLKAQSSVAAKTATLQQIIEHHMYNDSRTALRYSDTLIRLTQANDFTNGLINGYFLRGNSYGALQMMDSAEVGYLKTLEVAKSANSMINVASAMANLSVIEGERGNYGKAISLMDSVARINLQEADYLNYGVTLNNRAYHFYEQGDFVNAMNGFREALQVLDTIHRDIFRQGDVLRNIGKLNYQQEDYADATDYLLRALAIYKEVDDHLFQAYVLVDLGNVHLNTKEYPKALEYLRTSLAISEERGFNANISHALCNIGIALREQGKYPEAIRSFLGGLNVPDYDISSSNAIIGDYHIGYTYGLMDRPAMAFEYLNRAIFKADSLKLQNELGKALNYRHDIYRRNGNFEAALEDKTRMEVINDSLFSLQKTRQIEQLQTLYETERKEGQIALQKEEIRTLNEKAKVDKLTKGLYAGGMFTFVTVSGLLFFGFRQRIRKNQIEREKQEEIYRQEIEHKKKELATQTLHLVQKNTFLEELKDNLQNLRNSPEKFKMEFRRIAMLLKKEKASDRDWETFKTYFSEVHNDFDQKLKTFYPDISEKEIRLAAFLRMNLTTKEIAATMNVLPDSVLKSKYRLKKKLGLDKETDLNAFVGNL